jgi:predicted RNase H-like HicB family nuclease
MAVLGQHLADPVPLLWLQPTQADTVAVRWGMAKPRRYTVSDGKLVLVLEEAPAGGFVVSSPMDPALWTQAETIAEAFEMARDALKTLSEGREKLRRRAKAG